MAKRFATRCIVVAATAAVIGVGIVGPAAARVAGSHHGLSPAQAVGTHYAVTEPVCAAARPGFSACDSVRRVAASKNTPGARPYVIRPGYATGPAGGYTPADLAKAYGLSVKAVASTGQVVGIVDAYNDPNILSDLNHFDAQYKIPAETSSTFQVVGQTGTSALPANDTSGWSIEESLDVDSVRAVCRLCKIVLVETNSNSNANLQAGVAAAVGLGATEVSNSYGGSEPASSTPAQKAAAIAAYNYPGVVITASTGDNGWYDFDYINENFFAPDEPEEPASLPDVVSVGGTSLDLTSTATRSDEHVWNHNGLDDTFGFGQQRAEGASGGGCSTNFTAQGWQLNVPGYGNTGCGTMRLSADISAVADPYTGFDLYDSYNFGEGAPGWATYGGTSLSSPLIVGMWALAGGSGGVAYPSLSLYGHSVAATKPFYDVTVGGNAYCGGDDPADCSAHGPLGADPNVAGYHTVDCAYPPWTSGSGGPIADDTQCNAVTGYDGPSGVGTPKGVKGFTAMHPTAKIVKPSKVVVNKTATFKAGTSTDPFPGGSVTSATWNWGDSSPTSSGLTATHVFTAPGTYTVTVTVTDNYGSSATKTATVTVLAS